MKSPNDDPHVANREDAGGASSQAVATGGLFDTVSAAVNSAERWDSIAPEPPTQAETDHPAPREVLFTAAEVNRLIYETALGDAFACIVFGRLGWLKAASLQPLTGDGLRDGESIH